MNTENREREQINQEDLAVPFLHVGKKVIDWRHKAFRKLLGRANLFQAEDDMEALYWIGVIRLEGLNKERALGVVYFVNENYELEVDGECEGHNEEGIGFGDKSNYLYSFGLLKDKLVAAKKAGYKYFNILIKETVDRKGAHQVSFLYKHEPMQKFGVPSKDPWPLMFAKDLIEFKMIGLSPDFVGEDMLVHSLE